MLEFVLRRVAAAVVTLAAATVVIFLVLEILPGDPAEVMLGTEARADTLAALRAKYGFDRPAPERYLAWIGGLMRLDLGTSHAYGTSVAKMIGERLQVTLPLGVMALGWATLVAIPLGVFAAARHGHAADWTVMGFAQLGISTPNFWFGLMLVLLFAVTWQIFPAGGFPGWGNDVAGSLRALILPALALSFSEIAILARVTPRTQPPQFRRATKSSMVASLRFEAAPCRARPGRRRRAAGLTPPAPRPSPRSLRARCRPCARRSPRGGRTSPDRRSSRVRRGP